jgi:polyisoprenoid-binding protein YceI
MTWKIDTAHTQIQFSVRHMMISKVRGQFEKFSGTINPDEAHPEQTTVDIQIETASINTREPQRDNHLRSPDFFNAAEFPIITYKGTKVDVYDATHAHLTGDLNIHGITRPVVVEVEYLGKSKGMSGEFHYGFTGSAKINRKDWGLVWNVALETGGVLVGDEIEVAIELELIQEG